MNCDIYRSSPGVYCMVLFPTCNKNLPIVSTAFQWHPQYNKLKARVSQSHKVRPIIHTQWQDANLSFAKRFPIPNKIYNFMCENVNSFTDSDKELMHSWFSWDRFGKSANKAYKYIELSSCFIGRSSIAIIWQNILGNCLTGIINISLRTKATNAKVCEVQHHNLKVNVQQQHILQKLDEIWVTYYHSIHQSINHFYCIIALITEQIKKRRMKKIWIWTTTITKCMFLLFQIIFCTKITNVQGHHRVSKENTVYIKWTNVW